IPLNDDKETPGTKSLSKFCDDCNGQRPSLYQNCCAVDFLFCLDRIVSAAGQQKSTAGLLREKSTESLRKNNRDTRILRHYPGDRERLSRGMGPKLQEKAKKAQWERYSRTSLYRLWDKWAIVY
ncbi:hypothetical protein M8C21_019431, partial [Ambrosia artemisiifolia]